jgi:hypothetical protein
VYLKRQGHGTASVSFEDVSVRHYVRKEFPDLSDRWEKYTAEFTAPEDADLGRVRIVV